MSKIKITIEGDDKDELVASLNAALGLLGGEAETPPAKGDDDEDEKPKAKKGKEKAEEPADDAPTLADVKDKIRELMAADEDGGEEKAAEVLGEHDAKKVSDLEEDAFQDVIDELEVAIRKAKKTKK